MRSMTGFGRCEKEESGHRFLVEIKSVNHRFLDINVRVPRTMLYIEEAMREYLKTRLSRGRVEVFVTYTPTAERERTISVDTNLIKSYWEASRGLMQVVPAQDDITLQTLMKIPDAVVFEQGAQDDDVVKNIAMEACAGATDMIINARSTEGVRISEDILMRIDTLQTLVKNISQQEPVIEAEYREKLKAKLDQTLAGVDIDENRLAQEVMYFADRSSVTEETVRLNSHLEECKNMLKAEDAGGRSLDFIVQELNREFNTIGSKSSDVTVTKWVIDGKTEVEKIREQVQNIE